MKPDEMAHSYVALTTLRPLSEWCEDDGDVLWWYVKRGKIQEGPWAGSPLVLGKEVLIETRAYTIVDVGTTQVEPYQGLSYQRVNIGGWPGYHTHWTPLPKVTTP